MTNWICSSAIAFLRSASSTTYRIRSKLRSGSPPWNSMLISRRRGPKDKVE